MDSLVFEALQYIPDSNISCSYRWPDGHDNHIRHLSTQMKLKYPYFPKREIFRKKKENRKKKDERG